MKRECGKCKCGEFEPKEGKAVGDAKCDDLPSSEGRCE